jgi:UDP-N-acetylmuramoyl-L-alanyl-D-glutamate--2,6-diaminopimelate ligase
LKRLADIVKDIDIREMTGPSDPGVQQIHFDSRKVQGDSLFVAIKGTAADGHRYIGQAIQRGAVAVLCEQLPGQQPGEVTFIRIDDTREGLGIVARNFYDNPSEKLKLVGVTGTNGKTTIAALLHDLFMKLECPSGLISTIGNKIRDESYQTLHTTPDALSLHALMHEMVNRDCDYCFMEVSSHAIDQKRISGLTFTGALFTNVTHDHLDYHASFKEYIRTKKSYFDGLSPGAFALINKDDRNGQFMVQNTPAKVISYALKSMADYSCRILEQHMDGSMISLGNKELWTHLIGEFNIYNLLCVYASALILGQPGDRVLEMLSQLKAISGRLESIRFRDGKTAFVDYAHTPDALKNVLLALKKIMNRDSALITVIGAGGNRDTAKRPLMARIACEYSDRVILTSDNPRNEKPDDIIEDMMRGVEPEMNHKVLKITDREEALKAAVLLAGERDILLVAGKGHETYQEVAGRRRHFDDREVIRKLTS